MNNYRIEFGYNTDLRDDIRITAVSAVHALCLAESENHFNEWCSDPGFWVKITRIS
jgi:hypothetical protein